MYIARKAEEITQKNLKSKKILLILGARQVGKTTLVKHVLQGKKVVYLNLDITVDKDRFLALSSLSPQEAERNINADYLIIDEAQRLSETGRITKGWYDFGVSFKIILLGSSSLNLLDQAAESLTGRNEKIFLPPFLFKEIIASADWYLPTLDWKAVNKNFSAAVKAMLLSNLAYGSYPEVVASADKENILLNLANDYLWKDILQMGEVKNPDVIKRLLVLLSHQIGSEVSINELSVSLGLARATIEKYLDLLEQSFVIFRLPAYSTNARKEVSKSKKIYFYDVGIRNAVLKEFSDSPMRSDIGALWENWVIAEMYKENMLSGNKKDFYFWRSRSGSEVDLLIKEGGKLSAYDIKWQEKSIKTQAFTDKYKIPVKVLHSGNPFFC